VILCQQTWFSNNKHSANGKGKQVIKIPLKCVVTNSLIIQILLTKWLINYYVVSQDEERQKTTKSKSNVGCCSCFFSHVIVVCIAASNRVALLMSHTSETSSVVETSSSGFSDWASSPLQRNADGQTSPYRCRQSNCFRLSRSDVNERRSVGQQRRDDDRKQMNVISLVLLH